MNVRRKFFSVSLATWCVFALNGCQAAPGGDGAESCIRRSRECRTNLQKEPRVYAGVPDARDAPAFCESVLGGERQQLFG